MEKNVCGVDHGPGLPDASLRRTRHTYGVPAAGIGEAGAYAAVLTVAENTRLAALNDRSLFLYTSTVYDAAKGAAPTGTEWCQAPARRPTGDDGTDWRAGLRERLRRLTRSGRSPSASKACTRQK